MVRGLRCTGGGKLSGGRAHPAQSSSGSSSKGRGTIPDFNVGPLLPVRPTKKRGGRDAWRGRLEWPGFVWRSLAFLFAEVVYGQVVLHGAEAQPGAGSPDAGDVLVHGAVHVAGQGHMPVIDDDMDRRNRAHGVARQVRVAEDGARYLQPQAVICR